MEATSVPALEPGFQPFGVQVSEEFLLKAQLPAQVAMIVEAQRPQPAPDFPCHSSNGGPGASPDPGELLTLTEALREAANDKAESCDNLAIPGLTV